jgi:hypothetical protein
MKNKLRLWLIEKLKGVPLERDRKNIDSILNLSVQLGREQRPLARAKESNTHLRESLLKLTSTLPNIKDSDKNEGTSFPWWAIVVPRQIMRKDPCAIASCIVGVWFSRESAEAHLNSRRHEYDDSAIVYCFSGYWSAEYKQLLKDVSKFRNAYSS